MFPFQCTRGAGCGKRFRAASTRDKHMFSACPIKITCAKCGTEFATQRKHHTHLSSCLGAPLIPSSTPSPPSSAPSVPSSTPPLPSSTSLIPSVAPLALSSTPPPPSASITSSCAPCSSGDQPVPKKHANVGPYLVHEDAYSVMLDSSFNLPSFELPAMETFDLDKYLTGEADFDLFSDND